jgi:GAF domain-containing protein
MDTPPGSLAGPDNVLHRIRRALETSPGRDEALRQVVRVISDSRPHYTWTGIYLLEGDTLVLHNQIGSPTPHVRIPVGQGICGLAARERRTVLVPDVSRDPRYLACSLATRSEIVVPIQRGADILGEIDIDSDRLDAFDDDDRRLLEEAARLISPRI